MSTIISGDGITTLAITAGSYNQGQLAGVRNKIINGAFQINQRVYVSGAATTVGQYTLDRWKVTGTGGVTFSAVNNKTTVTIPAGQTLQQIIEGLNLQSGDYVLSWEGTAQGRIGAGAYGNSGEVTATIVGGTDTTIEFGSGTVSNVQLELGTVATPFEGRFYGGELSLCQRYYERASIWARFQSGSGGTYTNSFTHKQVMRAEPTLTKVSETTIGGGTATSLAGSDSYNFYVTTTTSSTTQAGFTLIYEASAEL